MSVKGWYADLRVDRKTNDIDWAIAGQRVVDTTDPSRVQFTHELDSHNSFDAVDCGTFSTLPNGDDLETGSMPRPDLPGAPVTEYEEVWRELPFRPGPEGSQRGLSWVLESKGPEVSSVGEGGVRVERTFLARIWGTYLALRQVQTIVRSGSGVSVKSGEDVSARREEWDESTGWTAKYVLGKDGESLPSMADVAHEGEGEWRTLGGMVRIQEAEYTVRAFEEIM
ncbi:hypothetical protein ATERTT37_003471 [Aspergillus terreus]